jgi:hypothetical protein
MSLVRSSNLFGSLSNLWTSTEQCPVFINVSIDWKETPKVHKFTANLPDVKKEAAKRSR